MIFRDFFENKRDWTWTFLRLCWTQNEPDSLKQSNTVWVILNESFKRVTIIYSNVDHLRIGVEWGHVGLSRDPIPLTLCQVKLNCHLILFYILKTCANTNFQNYLNIGHHSNADHMIISVSFKIHFVLTNCENYCTTYYTNWKKLKQLVYSFIQKDYKNDRYFQKWLFIFKITVIFV